jgi:DNA invertase Pin-like site-specific DNA recombinase
MEKPAISYLRFSSQKQRKGGSYERQLEETKSYCEKNGLRLIEQLEDLGVSGWSGANLDGTAALGNFLKQAQAGKFPPKTTLILENLDRLTRQSVLKAVNLLTQILELGIDIVTTQDGAVYTSEEISRNPMQLIVAITFFIRGNEESETKSKRVKSAWKKIRNKIKDGEFAKVTQHPNWLKIQDGKYEIDQAAAKLINKIFQMYLSGQGSHVIAKKLNQEGEKPYTRRSKKFTFSSIERILKNESVIGTCFIVSPPKKNYWPRIISDELWYKVQALRNQNNHYKGTRNDVKKINFVSGLAYCARCGGSMVRYSCKAKGKKYNYLTCSNAKYGEHSLDLVPYEDFEYLFSKGLREHGLLEKLANQLSKPEEPDRTNELQGKLNEIDKRIKFTIDLMIDTMNEALKSKLLELESQKENIENEIKSESMRFKSAIGKSERLNYILENIDIKLNDNEFRFAFREFLRKIIKEIRIGRAKDESGKDFGGFFITTFKHTSDVFTSFVNPNKTISDYDHKFYFGDLIKI